jgi:hypothetical protein
MASATIPLLWSGKHEFEIAVIRQRVPNEPGVYELLQSSNYPRYRGLTRTLKIGMSNASVQQELLNHFVRHAVANRLTRIRNVPGLKVTFHYAPLSAEPAATVEKRLPRELEGAHWDLPLLNSTRGYERGKDRDYCD